MYTDIVFPNGNEEQFVEIASRLGYTNLYFIYPLEKFNETTLKNQINKISIKKGLIANTKNFQKAKNLSKFVIVRSSNENRHILEKLKPDVLFDLEKEFKKDFVHHRASGLNQIMCKIAHENKVAFGFSASSDSQTLGRISQNIKLCRKYKVDTVIASFASSPYQMRSPHDLIALFICLGMHPSEAKKSSSFFKQGFSE